MALLYFDGFETEHSMGYKGQSSSSYYAYSQQSNSVVHSGNYSFRVWLNYNSDNYNIEYYRTFSNMDSSTIIVGFGLYYSKNEKFINGFPIITLGDEANSRRIKLTQDSDSYLLVTDFGSIGTNSIIAKSTLPLGPNAWHYIQIKYVQHPVNGELKVLIGNELVIDVTHQDFHSNLNIPNYVKFLGRDRIDGIFDVYFDDMYFLDGNPPLNDFLGVCNIIGLMPSDEGYQNDFEVYNAPDHTAALSELVADSNTYIWSAIFDSKVLFKKPVVDTTGNIVAVSIEDWAARSDAGSGFGKYRYLLRDSTGNEWLGDEFVLNSSTFSRHLQYLYNNPITGLAWDTTSLNDLEFGLKVTQVE